MKTVGNVLWFIFIGLWTGVMVFLSGLIFCITIIGIPFGLQAFKIAKLSFFPFGKKIEINFSKHVIGNCLWIICGGFFEAMAVYLMGALFCVTIIGIPVGLQAFKFGKLLIAPFGSVVTNC